MEHQVVSTDGTPMLYSFLFVCLGSWEINNRPKGK
jgi:hypothetical protein